MNGLVVLVPVLGRPHRVAPTLEAFTRTSPGCRVLFVPDPDDEPERAAIRAVGAHELPVDGGYARKINEGVRGTVEPLIFLGADDLDPQPGWLQAATATLTGQVGVVGVNDLLIRSRREHATHFLMTREYARRPTIDGALGPLAEIYDHSCVDDELIATARLRGAYAYAADAHVRHLHPDNGLAEIDDTYRKGRAEFRRDRRLWRQRYREHLR